MQNVHCAIFSELVGARYVSNFQISTVTESLQLFQQPERTNCSDVCLFWRAEMCGASQRGRAGCKSPEYTGGGG